MCEIILSVIAGSLFLAASFLIGCSVGSNSNRVNIVRLSNGGKIHMWKGFVDPTLTFVACETGKNGEHIDGDGVVFDEKGNIILVETHDNKG
jgi:hypothetical protein